MEHSITEKERIQQIQRLGQSNKLLENGKAAAKSRIQVSSTTGTTPDEPATNQEAKLVWSPHLRTILAGTRDESSPWHLLRGREDTLVREICQGFHWSDWVQLTHPANQVARQRQKLSARAKRNPFQDYAPLMGGDRAGVRNVVWDGVTGDELQLGNDRPPVAFSTCGELKFPAPTGIKVTMMPFIMGDEESLPEHVRQYFDCIMNCPVQGSELGKVCYLTIHEGFIHPGATQRHPGLHIDDWKPKEAYSFAAAVQGTVFGRECFLGPDDFAGGVFVASTMTGRYKVYNALVNDPSGVDSHGGVEYVRPHVGAPHEIPAHALIWLTERTPYEVVALPVDSTRRYCQFFRLITSDISVWYENDSTLNPLVALPADVVFKGRKFARDVAIKKSMSNRSDNTKRKRDDKADGV